MAVEELNKAGGVNGMPIEMVEYDTDTHPAQAAALTRKLSEIDKVLLSMGPFYSMACEVVFPATNRGNLQRSFKGWTQRGKYAYLKDRGSI